MTSVLPFRKTLAWGADIFFKASRAFSALLSCINQKDEHRLKKFHRVPFHTGNTKGDGCRNEQDDNHNIFKLVEEPLQIALLLFLLQAVGTVLLGQLFHLLSGKPGLRIAR